MNLQEIIKKEGFFSNGEFQGSTYSSCVPNGLQEKFTNNDGRQIIWGLNEKGYPPTLVYPRPNIIIELPEERIIIDSYVSDVIMLRLLSIECHQKIFNSLWDRDIFFTIQ